MMKALIITNKDDITSDFIIKELKRRSIPFYRFNTEELAKNCVVTLDIKNDKFILEDRILQKEFDLKDFTSVYFRRPEISTTFPYTLTSGEVQFVRSELFYTLEGIYKILNNSYWISPVYAIREAENKIYQLQIAKSIGLEIPDSIITNSFSHALDFYEQNNSNCIVKPIKSGFIESEDKPKIVFTNIIKEKPSSQKQIESLPNFFQSHVKKYYDVRVTMVGEKAFATLIHSQNDEETTIDWRRGEQSLEHTKFDLPKDILDKCITLLKTLNLRFGAIDFILDKNNELIFLEINPNGQWAWIEKQTGYEISKEIVNLLEYEYF